MAITTVSCDDFDSVVVGNPLVLVFFWTPWCKPCRQFAPVFENSSCAHPGLVHATVNTDAEQDLISKLRIFAVPCLMAFHDGKVVYNRPGALSAPELDELTTTLSGLDMPEVRATMVAHAAATPA